MAGPAGVCRDKRQAEPVDAGYDLSGYIWIERHAPEGTSADGVEDQRAVVGDLRSRQPQHSGVSDGMGLLSSRGDANVYPFGDSGHGPGYRRRDALVGADEGAVEVEDQGCVVGIFCHLCESPLWAV